MLRAKRRHGLASGNVRSGFATGALTGFGIGSGAAAFAVIGGSLPGVAAAMGAFGGGLGGALFSAGDDILQNGQVDPLGVVSAFYLGSAAGLAGGLAVGAGLGASAEVAFEVAAGLSLAPLDLAWSLALAEDGRGCP